MGQCVEVVHGQGPEVGVVQRECGVEEPAVNVQGSGGGRGDTGGDFALADLFLDFFADDRLHGFAVAGAAVRVVVVVLVVLVDGGRGLIGVDVSVFCRVKIEQSTKI